MGCKYVLFYYHYCLIILKTKSLCYKLEGREDLMKDTEKLHCGKCRIQFLFYSVSCAEAGVSFICPLHNLKGLSIFFVAFMLLLFFFSPPVKHFCF